VNKLVSLTWLLERLEVFEKYTTLHYKSRWPSIVDAEAEEEQDWPFKSEVMDNYDSLIHSQIIEYNMTAPSSTIQQQSAIIDTSHTSNTTPDPSSTVESNVLFEPTT